MQQLWSSLAVVVGVFFLQWFILVGFSAAVDIYTVVVKIIHTLVDFGYLLLLW